MKKFLLLTFAALLFCSCEDNIVPSDFLKGTWVQLSNGKASSLILTFDDINMTVDNATLKTPPFNNSISWDYYLTSDSTLVISYEYYDEDGSYTDYYDLSLSTGNDYNTLYLSYYRNRNHIYDYTFIRR